MALTPKQETFCQEYLVDSNATQAAIRAGYSEKTAGQQGEQLLKKLEVASRVRDLQAIRAEKVGIDAEWVLRSFVHVARRCMEPKPVMEHTAAGLVQATTADGEGVWEFDSNGANKALEHIGKHLGFFEKNNTQKQQRVVLTIGGRTPANAAE